MILILAILAIANIPVRREQMRYSARYLARYSAAGRDETIRVRKLEDDKNKREGPSRAIMSTSALFPILPVPRTPVLFFSVVT